MAKRKQIEQIKGLPKNQDKMLVQKSNPLYSLWKSGLTLSEFKILDVYLSRIDSHHPEKRDVVFEKGELEHLLGVEKINRDALDKRLDHLLGQVVTLEDHRYKRGIHKVTLFEESEAQPDDNGIWTISLSCTEKAMEYFFNTEKLGYLRYRLRSVVQLKSRYSYILFCYLEKNRFRKSWTIPVDDLKELLGATEEMYSQYKYFKKFVLEKAHTEICKKTDCKYTYESIKKGRRVALIKFTVETLADLEEEPDDPDQVTIEQYEELLSEKDAYATACEGAFDPAGLEEITAALEFVPESKLPQGEDLTSRRAAYLHVQYARMKKYAEKHKINSPQAYLVKMLTKEAAESAPEKPENTDDKKSKYADLEATLLGEKRS